MQFQFPRITAIGGLSLVDQVRKIRGECDEALDAIENGLDMKQAHMEVMDIYHASESALRMIKDAHGPVYLEDIKRDTTTKNADRGYYAAPVSAR